MEINRDHILLINITTGVNREGWRRVYLYPAGSTDSEARIDGAGFGFNARIYLAAQIASPARPGEYEVLPID